MGIYPAANIVTDFYFTNWPLLTANLRGYEALRNYS